MGTDRYEAYRKPCKCGEGEIYVNWCSPDHGWSARSWYEHGIECARCRTTYQIVERGFSVYLVSNDVLAAGRAAQAASEDAWRRRCDAFVSSPKAKAILDEAERRIKRFPSMAAAHRQLNGSLARMPLGRFRDSVNAAGGLGPWLRDDVSPSHLVQIGKWIGQSDAQLEQGAEALSYTKRERSKEDFTGELLCKRGM